MNATDILLLLADGCAKATLIIAVTWLLGRFFPQSSATRRTLWLLAFAGATLAPLLSRGGIYRVELSTGPSLATHPLQAPLHPETLPLPALLVAIWLFGCLLLFANALIGFIALKRTLRRSSAWAHHDLDLEELSSRAGVKRPWRLRLSHTDTPTAAITWGWLYPVVLLPRGADAWDEARLQGVLLHELAHIRRGDSLFQVLCGGVCAVLWFNPAAWLAAAALRADAEAAADEAVLDAGMKPSDYASALLLTALEVNGTRQRRLAGVAFMRRGQLERRIASIVHPRSGRRVGRTQTRIAIAAVLLATAALGAVRTSLAQGQEIDLTGKSKAFMDGYRAGMAYSAGHAAGNSSPDATEKMRIEIAARKNAGLDVTDDLRNLERSQNR